MNRVQWFVLGAGLIIFGWYLMNFGELSCADLNDFETSITACFVRRYAYTIPAMVSYVLGFLSVILGFLEFKKNEK